MSIKVSILRLLGCMVISSTAYAETCPTLQDIKATNFDGWRPLYIDSANEASSIELQLFIQKAASFALAEWMKEAPEGSSHCYYADADKSKILNIYLAKQHLTATGTNWQHITAGISQCRASITQCNFILDSNI